jgi:hypothetical protein
MELTKEDDLLGFNPFVDQEQLISIAEKTEMMLHTNLEIGITTFFLIDFKFSSNVIQYKRKVFNILELTGILGGIFEVFDIAFGFILGGLSSLMFKKDLREDVAKAEEQYNSLKITIEELRKEVRSNQQPQNLPQEEEKVAHPGNDVSDQIDRELHRFTRNRRQKNYQVIDEEDLIITKNKESNLANFSKDLD